MGVWSSTNGCCCPTENAHCALSGNSCITSGDSPPPCRIQNFLILKSCCATVLMNIAQSLCTAEHTDTEVLHHLRAQKKNVVIPQGLVVGIRGCTSQVLLFQSSTQVLLLLKEITSSTMISFQSITSPVDGSRTARSWNSLWCFQD